MNLYEIISYETLQHLRIWVRTAKIGALEEVDIRSMDAFLNKHLKHCLPRELSNRREAIKAAVLSMKIDNNLDPELEMRDYLATESVLDLFAKFLKVYKQ